ncbi:MAG: response regulator [Flavobacteriaceae bacterium]|nr:response regulator [Flavobacteriaceae bacterium]
MLKNDLHRLLRRQITKSGFTFPFVLENAEFFEMINEAYMSFDKDILHVEHILEESSKELFKANQALQSENDDTKSKLDNIVNTIKDVLFQTDNKGNFIYLNHAWEELTGLTIKNSLNKNYKELLKGMNKAEKFRLQEFLLEEQEEYKVVFKYYTPNQDKKWIDLQVSRTKDCEGRSTGAIGTMADVTQIKETEIELQKASKIKDDFISTISHEIRTPLNAVIGLSNVMLMENFLPDQLENLEALKYSGEHLLALINDLLDLNKLQSEEIQLVQTDFDLKELLNNLLNHFKPLAKDKFLTFRVAMDKRIPNNILGDSLKLSQVLNNLLSNSHKFTETGAIVLSVKLLEESESDIRIRFMVKDTGIGVPYNKQGAIFKSFVQAGDSTKKLYGGSGLGLTISRKILQLQDSDLRMRSVPKIGSEFWFDITYKKSKLSNNTLPVKSEKTATDPIDLRVLVAEDNKLNVLVLRKLFAKWKIHYEIAENGKKLLEAYSKRDYDLILMDLQMPVLDGYETTRKIRSMKDSIKSSIPIIALTAFAENEVKVKTRKFKMDGYMSKPFDANEFHELLSFYSNRVKNVG